MAKETTKSTARSGSRAGNRNTANRNTANRNSAVQSVRTLAPRRGKFALVIATRFLGLLGLGIWLGGLAFFGAMAAPAMFKISRAAGVGELAPQMVGVMLSRFNYVMYGCGVLLLLSWLIEPLCGAVRDGASRTLWWIQGACSIAMLAIAIYLGTVMMPQLTRLQSQVKPGATTVNARPGSAAKARFDNLHGGYSGLAAVTIYLGFAALLATTWRFTINYER